MIEEYKKNKIEMEKKLEIEGKDIEEGKKEFEPLKWVPDKTKVKADALVRI